MHRYKRLLRYAFKEWPSLLLILALTAGSAGLAALQPWPIKLLVDYGLDAREARRVLPVWLGQAFAASPQVILILLAALAGVALFAVYSALDLGLTFAWTRAGQRMVYDLASDLFQRFQRLSLLFHSRRTVGDSLSRLSTDTWCVYAVADGVMISPLQHILTLAAIGAVAWRLDPRTATLAFAATPLLAASGFFFGRALKARARRHREARSRLVAFVHQTLTALPVVQAFGMEPRTLRTFFGLAEDTVAVSQRETLLKNTFGLVNGLTTTIAMAVVLLEGGRRVLSGALSVGSLLVLIGYVRSLQGATQGLLGVYGNLKGVEASMDRVLEVLDARDVVAESEHPRPLPALPPGRRGHIAFNDVSFAYEPDRSVLHRIALDVRAGETVALVGATGAGKTTLVSLLPRLYDPTDGRILFDGVDIRNVRLDELRAQVAVVLQDSFLLPLTVAQNISFGNPLADRAAIVAAARAANADAFVRELPDGYDTIIGERGATLSAGQRQRLAIARAILKDAAVLILDEPTSALDPDTEQSILQALERLRRGRTTFIVAHRLSTIQRADRIVVLEDGRIAETGAHAELLARGGAYARLHARQFQAQPREVTT